MKIFIILLFHVVCSLSQDLAELSEGSCGDDKFYCTINQCIELKERCNGIEDCANNLDELNCKMCGPETFQCRTGDKCIKDYNKCDGVDDCVDKSDELDCDNDNFVTTEKACRVDQWTCTDGECINKDFICDQTPDCADRSDEEIFFCKSAFPRKDCKNGERQCRNRCIKKEKICDGIPDCSDYSDEENCNGTSNGTDETEPHSIFLVIVGILIFIICVVVLYLYKIRSRLKGSKDISCNYVAKPQQSATVVTVESPTDKQSNENLATETNVGVDAINL